MAGSAPQHELESLLVRVKGDDQDFLNMLGRIRGHVADLTKFLRDNLRVGDVFGGALLSATSLATQFNSIRDAAKDAAGAVDVLKDRVNALAGAQERAAKTGATWAASMASAANAAAAAAAAPIVAAAAATQAIPSPVHAAAAATQGAAAVVAAAQRTAAASPMPPMNLRPLDTAIKATTWPSRPFTSPLARLFHGSSALGAMPVGIPVQNFDIPVTDFAGSAALTIAQRIPYGTPVPGPRPSVPSSTIMNAYTSAVGGAVSATNTLAGSIDRLFSNTVQAERAFTLLRFAMIGFVGYGVKAFGEFDDSLTRALARMGDYGQSTRRFLEGVTFSLSSQTITPARELNQALGLLATTGMNAAAAAQALSVAESYAVISGQNMTTATQQLVRAQETLGLSSNNVEEHLGNMTRLSSLFYRVHQLMNISVGEAAQAFSPRFTQALRFTNTSLEEGLGIMSAFILAGERGAQVGDNAALAMLSIQRAMAGNLLHWKQEGIDVFVNRRGGTSSMADIVEQLAKRTEGMTAIQRTAVLSLLGFDRLRANVILPLIQNAHAIRVMEEEAKRLDTTLAEVVARMIRGDWASQLAILKNNFTNLAVAVGQAVAPVLAVFNGLIKDSIQWLLQLNPLVRQTVILFTLLAVGGLPALRLFLSVASWFLAPLVSVLTASITGVVGLVAFLLTATPTLIGAFAAVGWPLLLVPLGILLSILPALVLFAGLATVAFTLLGGVLLGVGKWLAGLSVGQIKTGLLEFFEGIAAFFSNFIDNTRALLQWLGDNWKSVLKDVATAFGVFLINMLYNTTVMVTTLAAVFAFTFFEWLPKNWQGLGLDLINVVVLVGKALSWIFVTAFHFIGGAFDLLVVEYFKTNWWNMITDMGMVAIHGFTQAFVYIARVIFTIWIGVFRELVVIMAPVLAGIASAMIAAMSGNFLGAQTALSGALGPLLPGPGGTAPAALTTARAGITLMLAGMPGFSPTFPAATTQPYGDFLQQQNPQLRALADRDIAVLSFKMNQLFGNLPASSTDYGGLLSGIFKTLTTGFTQLRTPLEGFEAETTMTRRLRSQLFRLGPNGIGGMDAMIRRLFGGPGEGEGFEPMMSGRSGPGFGFKTVSLQRFVVGGPSAGMIEQQVFQAALLHKLDTLINVSRGNRPPPTLTR